MNEDQKQSGPQDLPSTFSQLVIMIATSALQQLGQVPDPSGQRGEIHLDGAQGMIDILEALSVKTKGNLDEGEKKILDESLTMLRMQYVEIAKTQGRGPAPTGGAEKPNASEPAPEAAPAQDEEPIQKPTDSGESKTRYRKSYG